LIIILLIILHKFKLITYSAGATMMGLSFGFSITGSGGGDNSFFLGYGMSITKP